MSTRHPTQRYREVQVNTASKDDLLLLLLDGGVRFSEGALIELEKGEDEEDRAKRNDHLVRAQKILLELMGSLSPSIGEELFANLQSLYRFTFGRLFQGNVKSDATLVSEGVVMMKRIRDLWKETVEHARAQEGTDEKQAPTRNSSISVTG